MSLSVNFFMPDASNPTTAGTTSVVFAKEAERRGYKITHTREQDLTYYNGEIIAKARDMTNIDVFGKEKFADLSDFYDINFKKDVDVVIFRPDINFNLHYLTITHLFEKIKENTLVVDDPKVLRQTAEKLFLTKFPDLSPPTLITSEPNQIQLFRDKHKDIIVKPLFGFGGEGIFHILPESDNLGCLLEMFDNLYHEPVMIQKYLPEIKTHGDKRVIMIDGEPVCALLRRAKENTARANVSSGGSVEIAQITETDRKICKRVAQETKKLGILFVGVDIVGDKVIEINVGTVGGVYQTVDLGGFDCSKMFWDAIEKRLENK